MNFKKLFVSIVCMCSCCAVLGQNVKLSTLFSDGCVLQQKSKVPVWGTADPGEAVVVSGSWNDEQVKVTADETGKWIAYLSTPAGGASSYTLNVNDEKVENVLVASVLYEGKQRECPRRHGIRIARPYAVQMAFVHCHKRVALVQKPLVYGR